MSGKKTLELKAEIDKLHHASKELITVQESDLKRLICLLVSVLEKIIEVLPDRLLVLKQALMLLAKLLESVCESMP